jgi:hypothetical protein
MGFCQVCVEAMFKNWLKSDQAILELVKYFTSAVSLWPFVGGIQKQLV